MAESRRVLGFHLVSLGSLSVGEASCRVTRMLASPVMGPHGEELWPPAHGHHLPWKWVSHPRQTFRQVRRDKPPTPFQGLRTGLC